MFVDLPWISTTEKLGDAAVFQAQEAAALIGRAQAAKALMSALPEAMREAAALGVKIPAWLRPCPAATTVAKTLEAGKAQEFDPAREFESKNCFAVYVSGEVAGFLNNRGAVKNELGEACLFSSASAAQAFAKERALDCFLVGVQASVTSCEVLQGNPSASVAIGGALASRERSEIREALAKAEIDMLRKELAKREAELERLAEPKASRGSSRL